MLSHLISALIGGAIVYFILKDLTTPSSSSSSSSSSSDVTPAPTPDPSPAGPESQPEVK